MSDTIARENVALVRNVFSDDDWQEVLARATLFALRLMRSRPEGARQAEDYAIDAAERFLQGQRRLTIPLEGSNPATLRRFVFMFFCGIIRSIMSNEKRIDRVDPSTMESDPPEPGEFHGMHNLFEEGSLEQDVLRTMLETDFDVPPRDIVALLREGHPETYRDLSVEAVYAARRRVRERLRALLVSEDERLDLRAGHHIEASAVYRLAAPHEPLPSAFRPGLMYSASEPLEQLVHDRGLEEIWTELDAEHTRSRIRSWLYDRSGLR